MPNLFKFADWITMESLRVLKNKLVVAEMFNTDYNKEFKREFAVGETVRVKLPQRFTIRDGIQYTPQALERKNTDVTVDQLFGIDFDFDSVEKALKMERGDAAISREYIEPAMAQIAQEIDSRAALWAYQNTNNIVGALGTNPTAISTYHSARQRLVENACPPGKRAMIVTPGMSNSIASNLTTLTNPRDQISQLFKEGYMGNASGFDWYESMSLYTHTAGTWAGAVTTSAAISQGASSVALTCTTGDTFKKGDILTFSSCNNVNPSTRRSTGSLKQVVVTEDTVGVASAATVKFAPALFGPGSQYQNCDALIGSSATVTLMPGTASPSAKSGINGLALHRDAFALVGVKLENPKSAELASQTRDPQTGISVAFVRAFDVQDRKMKNRFDVLLGFGNLYADQCAVRVASST